MLVREYARISIATCPPLSAAFRASPMITLPFRREYTGGSRDSGDRRAAQPLTVLAEDERIFRDSVREFADAQVRPLVREMDEHAKIPADARSTSCSISASWASRFPRRYGGAGGRFFHSVLAVEELSRVDPSVGVLVDVQNTLVINASCAGATTTSSAATCPRLAADTVGAYALSEAGSGSDAFALTTRAREDGDGYVLTGRKLWITNGNEADIFIVFATIDPEAGYRGITAFVVERGFAGLHRRQEGGQARHPREQHLRADLRGLPRAARERARRSRQGLQGRDRDAERRAHRHRRADDRPGAAARSTRRSPTRRSGSSSARRSPSSRRCSTRSRAPRSTWRRRR